LDDLPEEVGALGTPIGVFKARRSHALFYLILGVLTLSCEGLSMAVFLVSLLVGRDITHIDQPGNLFRPNLCSLAWTVLGAIMIYRGLQTNKMQVLVFPDALARVDRQGTDVVYWEDVKRVRWDTRARRLEMTLAIPVQLVLEREGGSPLVFSESVARLRDLRELVEKQTLPHLLPPALQTFRAGKTLSFGAVSVNRDGLQHPYGILPWVDLDSLEVIKGKLIIRNHRSWRVMARVPRSKVPNLHVLLALTQQALGDGPADDRITRQPK
jgi:hypothetical protein